LGVFILKNAISEQTINQYFQSYSKEIANGTFKKTEYHLTEIKIEADNFLTNIVHEPEFLYALSGFFNGNVGSDNIRIVRKDAHNFKAVFLHQDTCYQIGSFERYSFFIALTPVNIENGGLIIFPGTHKFGYLGDAGEISESLLPDNYPQISPNLSIGDILIMHSATWHKSPENTSREERVLLEVHIQHIDEPSTSIEICGIRKSNWRISSDCKIFKNSRMQKIKTLYQEIDVLRKINSKYD